MKNSRNCPEPEIQPKEMKSQAQKKAWEAPSIQEISRFKILGGIDTFKNEGQGASFISSP
jgi:hypothetical protein